MGYRSSLEAANARIEALEHDNAVLRAAVEDAHGHASAEPTTARERALTHELEQARRQIAAVAATRPGAGARASWAPLGVALLAGALLVGVALALVVSRREASGRARSASAPATSATRSLAPSHAEGSDTSSDELVCDTSAGTAFRVEGEPGTMLRHDE